MNERTWLSADQLGQAYRAGTYSPVDAVEASLARIDEVDAEINSMVTITADQARAQAIEAEKRLKSGESLPPLYGIPMTVKDLTDTAGVRTTYGSTVYADNVPTADALAWARLKAAGAILIGKATTPEFGMLAIGDSMLTGPTSTPWKIGYTAGGSSAGSASGVAAGVVPITWGSDGGGSIRVPASMCGVVGIKPSVGRIPHLDNPDPDSTEGPLARTVLDAAMVLDATAGRHIRDRFSVPSTGEVFADAARATSDLRGVRIAASVDNAQGPVDDGVRAAFEAALDTLRSLGATVDMVTPQIPNALEFFVAYWGPEVVELVDDMQSKGHPVWRSWTLMADAVRELPPTRVSEVMRTEKTALYNGYMDVFDNYDAIVTPTTPFPSFPHPIDAEFDYVDGLPIHDKTLELHRLTESPSHAGLPAISLPCGFTAEGLPVGLQVIAPMYEDSRAIFIASRFEQATEWHAMRPTLGVSSSAQEGR